VRFVVPRLLAGSKTEWVQRAVSRHPIEGVTPGAGSDGRESTGNQSVVEEGTVEPRRLLMGALEEAAEVQAVQCCQTRLWRT
jgi:hypothetical protein